MVKREHYKIIVTCPNYSSLKDGTISALQKLGHTVLFFDYNNLALTEKLAIILGNFNIISPEKANLYGFNNTQKRLFKLVKDFCPDILLVLKGEQFKKQTIAKLTQQGVTTINWYPDWLCFKSWLKMHIPAYSVFAATDLDTYKEFCKKNKSVIYLPFAAEIEPYPSMVKKFDITFVGQYSSRREKYFQHIADLGLKIWGYSKWQRSSLANLSHTSITPQKAKLIYKNSKIVVNIPTGKKGFEPNQINVRTFEAMGVGAFVLTQKTSLLKKVFADGRDIATFTSPNDLRKKAIYYLSHPQEREKIAYQGWLTVSKGHSYIQRMSELLTTINK